MKCVFCKRRTVGFIISISFIVLMNGVGCAKNKGSEDVAEIPRIITHACGRIDGHDYTNSLEALEYNYGLGQRAFEVDFRLTSDEKLVLKHEWNDGFQEGIDESHIPTLEEFKSKKILGKYTPMDINDLIIYMKEHEDIVIITDTKETDPDLIKKEFNAIKKALNEESATDLANRFIVQLYNEQMLGCVNEIMQFNCYIFTLYQVWLGDIESFPQYCEICKNNNIKYITMVALFATDDVLKIANDYGIEVCVHPVNNREEAIEYFRRGIHSIYTDDLVFSDEYM